MGYMRHHAIVVTSWSVDDLEAAHAEAVRLGCQTSPIVLFAVNRGGSFLVAPDGSKEGWPESDNGDVQRRCLIAWLDGQRYEDGSTSLGWVEVQFGDDDGVTTVVAHSDERERRLPGDLDTAKELP